MAETLDTEVVVHTPVTAPLLKAETIDKAISAYTENLIANDSVNAVSSVKEFLLKRDGAINFSLDAIPRSQDLPDIFNLNWAFSVISKADMLVRRSVVGLKPFLFEVSHEEGYDIDSMLQFELAEMLFKKRLE